MPGQTFRGLRAENRELRDESRQASKTKAHTDIELREEVDAYKASHTELHAQLASEAKVNAELRKELEEHKAMNDHEQLKTQLNNLETAMVELRLQLGKQEAYSNEQLIEMEFMEHQFNGTLELLATSDNERLEYELKRIDEEQARAEEEVARANTEMELRQQAEDNFVYAYHRFRYMRAEANKWEDRAKRLLRWVRFFQMEIRFFQMEINYLLQRQSDMALLLQDNED
ncbi:hypothetical protein PG988_012741 [Apiospora saccharicola]